MSAPGRIVDLSKAAPAGVLDAEICIIGSGSAGATAAWDLAAAGRDVLVLEEGGDYTGFQLTQRDGRMYDQLYMDRGGRSTADLGISVLQGRVLGGGGVINACDVVPLHDGAARLWSRTLGLTDYAPEKLAPFRDRALADLHANTPREDLIHRNNRLLREGANKLGWRGEVMLHNRVGCVGVGTCLIGCPLNAKKNPRFVAIPAALEAGARFFTRVRATRVEDAGGDVKTVRARRLDANGYHELDEVTVRAKVVILAANAIASAQLLLRSGLGGEHVGRHVSLQPQLPVSAVFPDEVRFHRGIPQAFAVTEHERLDDEEHGWWGFRLESISATPGIIASLMPEGGLPGKKLLASYAHLAAVLCLLPDDPVGHVEVASSGRLRIHYPLSDAHKARFREAARAAARAFLAAGASEVFVPVAPSVSVRSEADLALIDAIAFRPASAPFLSAHQQGGVRMSANAKDGVAQPDGLIRGTKDVYCFDSGLFPTSASSHTMTPIITVAHALAAQLEARLRG